MKRIIPLLIFFAGFISSFGLWAQTRCPVGVQMGSAQCIPDDEEGPAPSRPTGEWIKTWGSIVISESSGEAWTVVGKNSKNDAENDVLGQCAASGYKDCSVLLSYSNQCVAMTSPSQNGPSSAVTGKNKEIAAKRSIDLCERKNKMKCDVVYSKCSDPIFKKY